MRVYKTYLLKIINFFILLVLFTNFAESTESDTIKKYNLPNVSIISDRSTLMNSIPGSASIVNSEQLREMKSLNGNQIMRTITGINVVDEEGAGLRMNLGIRGLDPDRSRALLVLEDGVPVALAPYGEPEMYYTPSIDRMNSIEVLKGSGSIVYGPQTIGGVLNYITNDPPLTPETDFHLKGGDGGFLNTKLSYGTSSGSTGFFSELLYKKADNIGLTRYDIFDFMTKSKFVINNHSSISAKVGVYNEISNSTYVGITQSMYNNGDYFTEIAPNDELKIRRYSASLNYQNVLSNSMVFNTTVFAYNTARDWRRQDFGRAGTVSNKTGVVFGDTNVSGGAIYMRNSTGNRNRTFDVFGIQPQLITNTNIFGLENEINLGVRFLVEKAYEQRINGTNYKASSGNLVEDETRSGMAFSAYFQDRINVLENLIITPGIRFEQFNYERDIFRIASKDTSLNANHNINEFIPGLGINYNIGSQFTIFAGTHRGFAPPRTKDAITNEGTAIDLSAELSWNYELGIRTSISNSLYFEATAYMLDFSNQIIPVSESSGNLGFGLINGGQTMHKGLEFSVLTDISRALELNYSIIWSLNLTVSESKFNYDRLISSGNDKININGNYLPYAPNYSLSSMLNFKIPEYFGLNLSFSYIGEQFTDELNTVNPSNDGTIGKMPSFLLLNVTINYELNNKSDIYLSVSNLSDERYIASRRPQGIKVGIPRFITVGIDYHF
jgi:Fe(3+) dicitrate transport protein